MPSELGPGDPVLPCPVGCAAMCRSQPCEARLRRSSDGGHPPDGGRGRWKTSSSEGNPAQSDSGRPTELFLFRCQGATARDAVVPLENSIASTSIFSSPSYKEPTVDALAPEAEEGRGWLR